MDVSKSFGQSDALRDITLSVNPGELLALVGKSGSGKSTLLNLVNQMQSPTAGSIQILDSELSNRKMAQMLRSKVATIHQGLALVTRLSAIENAMQGALSSITGPRLGVFSYPKEIRKKAADVLSELGLKDKQMQPVSTLSGGQQQRVAIARALMQDPAVILADEPISSLDPQTATQVLHLIKTVSKSRGITLLMAIHQIDLVGEFAERVIGLQAGKIKFDTPLAQFDADARKELFGDA